MKLWGGRFSKNTAKEVDDFNSSIHFDKRLYSQDIKGSIAHARMLGKQGIITESDKIIEGLNGILADIEEGKIVFSNSFEDIHMNIESILTERIGAAGKKLHTGRSRNDQVALDTRLYVRDEIDDIITLLKGLMDVISDIAKEHTETIMPGYTHLQKAQPITLAHHLMAYFEMFLRDVKRLEDAKKRVNICPLGCGALATTTYPIDREMTANELLFDSVCNNSLDGVSDRDFVIEFISCISMIMMHLSRFSEEIILWQSDEFSFINLDDSYSTGSSIMPQKKNPDIAELVRGKTGRVYGDLMAILTTMKGLPLAYNKDMQEDKEPLFDAVDTAKMCIPIFSDMIRTMTVNKDNMLLGCKRGFTNATDIADYLAKKGVPFREAHEIVGKMVLYASHNNKSLDELTLDEYKSCSDIFEGDIYDAISMSSCVNGRNVIGGPAFETMKKAIADAKKQIDDAR